MRKALNHPLVLVGALMILSAISFYNALSAGIHP